MEAMSYALGLLCDIIVQSDCSLRYHNNMVSLLDFINRQSYIAGDRQETPLLLEPSKLRLRRQQASSFSIYHTFVTPKSCFATVAKNQDEVASV